MFKDIDDLIDRNRDPLDDLKRGRRVPKKYRKKIKKNPLFKSDPLDIDWL